MKPTPRRGGTAMPIDRREFLMAHGVALAAASSACVVGGKIRTAILGTQHSHVRGKLQAMLDSPPIGSAGHTTTRKIDTSTRFTPRTGILPANAKSVCMVHLLCPSSRHADPRQLAHAANRTCADALAPRKARTTAGAEPAAIVKKALIGSIRRFLEIRVCSQPRPIRYASSRLMNCRLRPCRSRID